MRNMSRLLRRLAALSTLRLPVLAIAAGTLFYTTPVDAATVATYQLGQGWATFGISLPSGVATSGLQVGTLETQTDVKNRWSDGSIRFAIVTAKIPSGGSYPINTGNASSGSYSPTWPSASVNFNIGGRAFTATLPAFSGTDSWLSGPLVREARVVVSPAAGGSPHPLLQVIFDVRSYSDGTHRLDVCVQNVRDISDMDRVSYDVNVAANGQTLWSKAGVTSYSYTRWRKTFAVGSTQASVVPDFQPFQQSEAVPRYLTTVVDVPYDTSGPQWDIMGFGNMEPSMVQGGGREDIAPFPWWQARYIARRSTASQRATMLNGNNSGSWSLHVATPDGLSIIRVTDAGKNNYWFDPAHRYGSDGPAAPARGDGWIRGVRMGDATWSDYDAKVDSEHVPNLTYLPYLVTGDRYYLDQTKFWAAWGIMQAGPVDPLYPEPVFSPNFNRSRKGAQGLMWVLGLGREYGWPLRNAVLAAVATPDSDPDKAYFKTIVQNNFNALGTYVTTYAGSGGITEAMGWEGVSVVNSAGVVTGKYTSIWRMAYPAWAVDFASRQGLWNMGQSLEFRNRVIRMQAGFINNIPDERGKCPYYPAVARVVNNGTAIQFMTSWSQVYSDNMTYPFDLPPANPGWWAYPASILGYYGADAYMLMLMGVRAQVPGAQQALNWLLAYNSGGATVISDVETRAGFAFAQGGGTVTSPPPPAPAPAAPTNIRIIR
jgi:hypothetical protein